MKRAALAVFGLIVAVPVVAVLASGPLLDSAAAHARMVIALERATGHPVRIDGPVRLGWSPLPEITVRDVAVLNGPGASRPALATVARVAARVALLPLLSGRVEVRDLVLDRPDILLERDGAGRGNWLPLRATEPAAVPTTPSTPGAHMQVALGAVTVTDGTLAWRGGPALTIRSLRLQPSGGPASGELLLGDMPLKVAGTLDAGGAVDLTATGPGLTLSASGQAGQAVAVRALVPDLSALSALAGRSLPPLHDVELSGSFPGPRSLHLVAGASSLPAVLPGLALERLSVEADAPDQPVRLTAAARIRDLPVAVAANAATLSAVLSGGAVPVQVKLLADGGSVDAQGTLDPAAQTAELVVAARVPDLRRTAGLAGQAWPGLQDLAVDARVLPRPGGQGVLVRGLRATAAQGDLAGDLAFGTEPRPSLRGSLVSQRLDLDGLLAAVPVAPAAAPAPVAAPTVAIPAAPASSPLPFHALLAADADLRLSLAQLTWLGAAYRAVQARVLLQDGRLRLDPVQMVGPGGPVVGQLLADARAVPPTAALVLKAPALDMAAAAAALGHPGAASGTVELDGEARGAGSDWQGMAATLDGHLAAAMGDGEIDNAALVALFGPALRAANLPTDAAGRSRVRCLAVRADAAGGQVALRTLALDSTRLRLEGEGSLNLVNDTLDLHLRPTLRLGPTTVLVPVHLTGPIRAPVPTVERGVVAPGRFGLSIGGPVSDPCPAALAAVRAR